jgi:hypothetical protein
MPYRYRRFYYNGPIEFEDWIIEVWIPRHRSFAIGRQWLESNIRYADWKWHLRQQEIWIEFKAFEGTKVVPVIAKARVYRTATGGIAKIRVRYVHSG